MALTDDVGAGALRCAAWARAEDVQPVGTAPAPPGWVVLDWPLPWPRDVAEIDELAPLHEAVAASGFRVQVSVPPDPARPRVSVYERELHADGWFAGMRRRSAVGDPSTLVERAGALVDAGSAHPGPALPAVGGTEVLVCSHGTRDRCCGSFGTALALDAVTDARLGGVGVRRTSHLGGHRFAATAVVLPTGTAWAFLDADLLADVVHGSVPVEQVLPRYRGSLGMAPGAAQAAEREAFRDVGWAWLGWQRRAVEVGGGVVRVEGRDPADGRVHRWEVGTAPGRVLPIPECGEPIDAARKTETEVVVTSVRRTSA